MAADLIYPVSPPVSNEALNALFAASWPDHTWTDFQPVLSCSLLYICAYQAGRLVGFVNVAWDGGVHAFLLDTTVYPEFRRRGIGMALVRSATHGAALRGAHWLHVDYEPHLADFYRACGFRPTEAGLIRLGG